MSSLSIFVVEILLVHIIRPRLVHVDELWSAKALGGFMSELEAIVARCMCVSDMQICISECAACCSAWRCQQ